MRALSIPLSMAALLALDASAAAQPAAPTPVHHTLSFPDARNQYLHVESVFPAGGAGDIELLMAVWTPGSYLVREYARHLEEITAATKEGAPLKLVKTRKNRWSVRTAGKSPVVIRYRVYCRRMSVQGNWVEADFASINGAPTFLTLAKDLEDDLDRPHTVKLALPASWERSVTGLPAYEERKEHYIAESFDILLDSPILAGSPAVYEFEVAGKKHFLVNQGEGGIWDGPRSAADVKKIVEVTYRFWKQLPYDKYVFLNLIGEGRGGLEHLNSTLMITSRWSSRVPKSYRRWLGLVSHEFFHTWNVKRLRPLELGPFDYENEMLTESLWIAEGITSYYDDLLLARADLYTHKQYFEALSKQIEKLQMTPGRKVQPLEMASFDTWIKFYRRNENSPNSTISYYTKGAVAGFLLDAKIRKATGNARSLDDVMRRAYDLYSGERGYTPEEFRAVASDIAGTDLSKWFHHALETTEEYDYDEALSFYGLRFKDPEKKEKKEEDDDESDDEEPKKKKAWLGLVTRNRNGRLVVSQVRRETPGYEHGFNVEDEILGIDDYRVEASKWKERLEQYKPGDKAMVLISRRDRLLRLPVVFGEEPPKRWQLEADPDATEEQKARLESWLKGS